MKFAQEYKMVERSRRCGQAWTGAGIRREKLCRGDSSRRICGWRRLAVAACWALLSPCSLFAEIVDGTVIDSGGAPIENARVRVVGVTDPGDFPPELSRQIGYDRTSWCGGLVKGPLGCVVRTTSFPARPTKQVLAQHYGARGSDLFCRGLRGQPELGNGSRYEVSQPGRGTN